MTHQHIALRKAVAACSCVLGLATACRAQHPAPMLMAAVESRDALVVTAFRALLDEIIGDSADRVCLSIASTAGDGTLIDADPSSSVIHLLRRSSSAVVPRSVCAEDERNFGNPRGLLRLRDVSVLDEHTLIVHAEAIAEHSARYECIVPRAPHGRRAQCRITARDWPGSQKR